MSFGQRFETKKGRLESTLQWELQTTRFLLRFIGDHALFIRRFIEMFIHFFHFSCLDFWKFLSSKARAELREFYPKVLINMPWPWLNVGKNFEKFNTGKVLPVLSKLSSYEVLCNQVVGSLGPSQRVIVPWNGCLVQRLHVSFSTSSTSCVFQHAVQNSFSPSLFTHSLALSLSLSLFLLSLVDTNRGSQML